MREGLIDKVVIFGDPLNGTAVGTIAASKVLVVCHPSDDICKGGIVVDSEHLDVSSLVVTAKRSMEVADRV